MGRPPARQRKPYDLDRIVDVAVRVFLERGYDGSTLEDIARAGGITKSSIYYHVASKEELLARGIDRALTALFKVLAEPQAREGRPIDRLRHIARRTVEISIAQLPEVALLLRVRGNTETERGALERRRQFDHLVSQLMAQAQRRREIRSGIDPAMATRLLFGMLNSVVEWYRPGGEMGAEEIAQAVLRMVFEGLARAHAATGK